MAAILHSVACDEAVQPICWIPLVVSVPTARPHISTNAIADNPRVAPEALEGSSFTLTELALVNDCAPKFKDGRGDPKNYYRHPGSRWKEAQRVERELKIGVNAAPLNAVENSITTAKGITAPN